MMQPESANETFHSLRETYAVPLKAGRETSVQSLLHLDSEQTHQPARLNFSQASSHGPRFEIKTREYRRAMPRSIVGVTSPFHQQLPQTGSSGASSWCNRLLTSTVGRYFRIRSNLVFVFGISVKECLNFHFGRSVTGIVPIPTEA